MAVAGLVVTAGCSHMERACTSAGAESGVVVVVPKPWPTQTVVVTACVGGSCRTDGSAGLDGPLAHEGLVFVRHPAVTARATQATIAVRDGEGQDVVPATMVTVRPSTVTPNGPRCDPTAYVGRATVTPTTAR